MIKNKGQLSEVMGFTILVIAITLFMIIYRLFIVSGSAEGLGIIVERHEMERLKSGANALFFMTEERTGHSLMNLIGTAALLGKAEIDFGSVGTVSVPDELTWRMNAFFGKNWHITIPLPKKIPDIQMVMVIDTSTSLCDDFEDMRTKLPMMIDDLVAEGKLVQATIFLLPGRSPCSSDYDIGIIGCEDFTETTHLKCKPIDYIKDKIGCLLQGTQTEEDWGNGIACASKYGPVARATSSGLKDGWITGAIKIGIPISDELPGGSEVCCTIDSGCNQVVSLQNGIDGTKDMDVTVFSLMANPCGPETGPGTSGYYVCQCKDTLRSYFDKISADTSTAEIQGKTFVLDDATKVSKAIKDIITSIVVDRIEAIDIGAKIPEKMRIRAYEVMVPLADGDYTKTYIYQWS